MGLTVTLAVQQCDDVVFDDIKAMNDELNTLGAGELLDPSEIEYWSQPQSTLQGFVKQEADGQVLLGGRQDGEWDGYSAEWVNIYGCIGKQEFEAMSRHMTAGKLVLRMDIEGNETQYYIVTPGSVEEKTQSALRF